MRLRAKTWIAITVSSAALTFACSTKSGRSKCFSPVLGPELPTCDDYDLGLTCEVGLTPYSTCQCQSEGAHQKWICAPAGTPIGTGGSATGGSGGKGGAGS